MSGGPRSGIPASISTAPQPDQLMCKDKVGHTDWERSGEERAFTPTS